MNELALFAGAGGGILGGKLLGWNCVCAVEYNAYARSVLLARQNDGTLTPFPIWDDVRTFDGKPWRGLVDVVSGGFPCQDISCAGTGAGLEGERSGLWSEFARIIGEVRPRYAFIENSPMLVSRGLDRVLCDLAALGFDAQWGVIGADTIGAPHRRERIWIVAHAKHAGLSERRGVEVACEINGRPQRISEDVGSSCKQQARTPLADTNSERFKELNFAAIANQSRQPTRRIATERRENGWPVEPELGRVANGVAYRADRLKAIGNGQVPRVAATAWKLLSQ